MFSGGLDVPHLIQLDRPAMSATWRDFYAMMRALATSPIPIAAAITGHAPAGGAVISLFCDVRIMADGDFKIGLNEVQVGLFLPPIIFKAMRRLVGNRQAERLCVAGLADPAGRGAPRRPGRRAGSLPNRWWSGPSNGAARSSPCRPKPCPPPAEWPAPTSPRSSTR